MLSQPRISRRLRKQSIRSSRPMASSLDCWLTPLLFLCWEGLAALIEHMRFVRDHHRNVDRVAVVTDSTILSIGPKVAEHFAHPEFKVFRSGEKANALAWLSG